MRSGCKCILGRVNGVFGSVRFVTLDLVICLICVSGGTKQPILSRRLGQPTESRVHDMPYIQNIAELVMCLSKLMPGKPKDRILLSMLKKNVKQVRSIFDSAGSDRAAEAPVLQSLIWSEREKIGDQSQPLFWVTKMHFRFSSTFYP